MDGVDSVETSGGAVFMSSSDDIKKSAKEIGESLALLPWRHRKGSLPVLIKNDYLFRTLMQQDENTLKNVIAACLHIPVTDIQKIEILTPFVYGDKVYEKELILDVRVLMNDNWHIDLELQVINYKNWPERSLKYVGKLLQLDRGEEYKNLGHAVHIGILDYNLFPDDPSFYASYAILNERTHHLYTDKLRFHIVCLPLRAKASDEDKMYHLDEWASFFAAKTWEDLQAVAGKNADIERAVDVVSSLIADHQICEIALARAKFLDDQRSLENHMNTLAQERDTFKQERDTFKQERDTFKQECDTLTQENNVITQERDTFKQERDTFKQKYNDFMTMMTVAVQEGKTLEELWQSFSGSQVTPSV